jgi:hypothetical protein
MKSSGCFCRVVVLLAALLMGLLPGAANGQQGSSVAGVEFFEKRIRPVLVERCYRCHNSSETHRNGLAVDHRAAIRKGGRSGSAVVPGDPDASLLLQAIRHATELRMPKDEPKLEPEVVADFRTWIEMGAPDPRDAPPSAEELAQATSWEATFEKRKKWWSFQPVVKPALPEVRNRDWSPHRVDRFLLAAMEGQGLSPAEPAGRRVLLRRVTYVLTGLPPTPEEIDAFLADDSPTAYGTVVDRLLESQRFGERWARHWMDLVRYCESHGSQGDPELPNAYRYRDYLIRAFNADVPYDQLVREHLAGDLLPQPRWNVAEKICESAIGPAHLRMVELGFQPKDAIEDQVKVVDNQIDVYSKAFLGLTASCARCHNHKFDPISQEDFYALYGIFVNCRPGQIPIDAPDLLNRNRDELTSLKQTIRDGLATAWLESAATIGSHFPQGMRLAAQIADLESRLADNREAMSAIEGPARAAALRNRGASGGPAENGSLPDPYARWSFDGDARDSVGGHHGELLEGATVRDGRLILDGIRANMRTVPLDRDIQEKTLEAWVSLSKLNQGGGGVLGVDTLDGQFFDSIVYAEIKAKHWMAGSEGRRRSQDPGGSEETAPPAELIHLAIVYAKDNSLTLYRNGEPYGTPYQKGTLRTFTKSKSRFLFGQRVAGANPPLAGEVDEARAYTRALTAAEIEASYRGGPAGISPEEIAAVLDEKQREKFAALRAEESRLREQLTALKPAADDPWVAAFYDARTNNANLLHVWRQFITDDPPQSVDAWREGWAKLSEFWRAELQSRDELNRSQFTPAWDLRTEQNREWFRFGTGLSAGSELKAVRGEFSVEPDGGHILKGIHPTGVYTHGISTRHKGVLTSPWFVIETDNVSVRAMGQDSMVRFVIENYADPIKGGGHMFPGTRMKSDQLVWLQHDTSLRKGSRAYIEFTTDEKKGRAFFGAAQVVTSNVHEAPRETTVPITHLIQGDPPTSPDELESRYAGRLRLAIHAWRTGSGGDEETSFLDFFLRGDLLPTTLTALPQLRESVERYRQLEGEIPVPRHAPGVLETTAFDQRLFERGQHLRPGQLVPRRGLSLFDSASFETAHSGRLQLAEQTASATNPLTARVMVNRLWQYVFGRGIVKTVDNFGHLGVRPTHPKLLDDLAARFVEQDWSVKKMLKHLVTARAFQQSSLPTDTAARTDPGNAFLSHMPVRRLDAEAIRDGLLATTGQLDPAMFGRGVNIYYTDKTDGGGAVGPLDGDGRRSVYLRIRRNAHSRFLEAFDAPKPSTTRGTRDTTNVPAQALTMLNDPFVIEQAAKWSRQLVTMGLDPTDRVRLMYQRAFARDPSALEIQATLNYIADLTTDLSADPNSAAPGDTKHQELIWQDVAHALFCLKEFIYVE